MQQETFADMDPAEDEEFFVVTVDADGATRLHRHYADARGARAHAAASGGRLYRGRVAVRPETLREVRLGIDDAY